MRRRVTVVVLSVCVCVCLSVKSHLTSGASVRLENTVTYSAGNRGQKNCGVFSETAPLRRSSTPLLKLYIRSAIFLRKVRIHIIVIKGHEYPRRGFCTSVHSFIRYAWAKGKSKKPTCNKLQQHIYHKAVQYLLSIWINVRQWASFSLVCQHIIVNNTWAFSKALYIHVWAEC